MTSAHHVAQAKYSPTAQQVMMFLSTLNPRDYPGNYPSVDQFMEADPKCFLYKDVPMELWREFKATGPGPEADVFWETRFHGQFQEQELDPVVFLLTLIQGH